MDADEDCEPPTVRLGMPMPPPPAPPSTALPPVAAALLSGSLLCVGNPDGASPRPSGCLPLLAMSSSSDSSSSCSDSDSTSTPSTAAASSCARCRLGFDTPGAWLAHLQDHRTNSSCGSVLTEVCSAPVASPDYHQHSHHHRDGVGLTTATAPTLGVVVNKDELTRFVGPQRQHHNFQHPCSVEVACDSARLPSLQQIAQQQQQQDLQEFRCPLCGACFSRSQNLERHVHRKHMGAESVECPDCGKCLSSSSSLKKHLRLHSGEAPFACTICSSAFRQKWELEKHLDTIHGDKELAGAEKPHRCDVCGRAFLYQNSCNAHRRLHQRANQCRQCGIILLSANDLRRHELSAHQPQHCWPYACHLCPERFTRKAHLDAHLVACQSRQLQQQQQQQQYHHSRKHHHHNHHLDDDPDLLRCLLRAVDSSAAAAAAAAAESPIGSAGSGGWGEAPDLSLLDSVLLASSAVDVDAVAYASQ